MFFSHASAEGPMSCIVLAGSSTLAAHKAFSSKANAINTRQTCDDGIDGRYVKFDYSFTKRLKFVRGNAKWEFDDEDGEIKASDDMPDNLYTHLLTLPILELAKDKCSVVKV
jgi:hypothetical protein